MASVVTNRFKFTNLGVFFRNAAEDANFTLLLALNSAPPTADTNTFSELAEIAAGNGYTSGGVTVNRDSTDFDTLTEDDGNDRAFIQMKDFVFTASGGNLPSSGNGARWGILADANATLGSRLVYVGFDFVSDRTVSDGQALTIQNMELRAA
jgi:hypothetical protein